MTRRTQAFSLIELLIVIAIIVLLTALLYPTLRGGLKQGTKADGNAFAANVYLALSTWLATHPTLDATTITVTNCAGATTLTASAPFLVAGNNGSDPGWPAASSGITCTLAPLNARRVRVTVSAGGKTFTQP